MCNMARISHEDTEYSSAATINHLKKQLKGTKRYFMGQITKLVNLISEKPTPKPAISQRRVISLDTFQKYSGLVQLLAEEDEILDDIVLESYYDETAAQASELITSPHSTINTQSLQPLQSQVKLPAIELPCFSGKYSGWSSFYDTFTCFIHDNSAISNIQKFHHLKSSLKGEAAQHTHSIEISATNYITAWSSLKNRYDNKRLIMYNINAILSLPNVSKKSFVPLRYLLDIATQNLHSLEPMNRPVENRFDDLIVHILTSELDNNTCREWETKIGANKFPNWGKLKDFLSRKCQFSRLRLFNFEYGHTKFSLF